MVKNVYNDSIFGKPIFNKKMDKIIFIGEQADKVYKNYFD